MKEFWEERYNSPDYVYGKKPNNYFKETLIKYQPGKILLPAEGEGRNAVFAARLGWDVTAFDISVNARNKAIKLAKQHKVTITYHTGRLEDLEFNAQQYDAIGLIYAHFPPSIRDSYHQKLLSFLKNEGHVIFEAFSKEQRTINAVNPNAGGPKDLSMLFSKDEILKEFDGMEFNEIEKKIIKLEEGNFHQGKSSVIRFTAGKIA